MSAIELISKLREAGIRLSVEGGKIKLKASKGKLTDELKQEIVAHKQEIVALLGNDADNGPALKARDGGVNDRLPLSYAQQRLWFLDELEPGTPVYNMPFAVRIRGQLNNEALQAALDDLVRQHESLRTVFQATGNEPTQRILENISVPINFEDLGGATEAAVIERSRELAKTRFSLAQGPLLKLNVLRTGQDQYLFLLVIHHIVSDLWSMEVFFRDLGRWYERHVADVAPEPTRPAVQYADYAIWQREWLSGDRLQTHLDYWLAQLEDAPPVLELPTDRPRPPEPSYAGNWLAIDLPAKLAADLQSLAQNTGTTMFMLTFAAFAALMHKYSGEDELVIGSPISGRQRTELEGLIGFFLNTLALRVNATDTTRFSDLLAQVKRNTLAAFAHQDLPFEKLVEELQPERDMSHTPVFQHMFIWQDSSKTHLQMTGLESEAATLVGHDTAKFDLTLAMTRNAAGIEAGIEYSTDLFDGSTIKRMLHHLQRLLLNICANPDVALVDIDLLDEEERRQVIETFNATEMDFGESLCVHELVERQAAATPDATAVTFGDESLTYAELERQANELAARLQRLGAEPGKRIAISCPRSLELAVAALATLKSGACYVPVDPNYPADRISAMLDDSDAVAVLTRSDVSLPDFDGVVVDLARPESETFADRAEALRTVSPADPLYCIYTSGSTGVPKGVQLSHAGLANLLRWLQQHERLGSPAKTLQFASFSFDVSFQELFSTWSTGGTLVMVDEELRQDLPALADFIAAEGIERLYLPFAALQPIAEGLVSTGAAARLRDIVVAGEALRVTPEVRALFATLDSAALHNQYGPSETHVVTALTLTGDAADWPALPSIGRPVANTRAYILDSRRRPVPIGVSGELYLGGVQVALGYLQRPELNAEKFSASPFVAGDRLYRTGDRARLRPDGQIDFLGRVDDQVKWRGFRIEPGEIESALTDLPEVLQSVVVLRDDGPGGSRQLVGYVTSDSDVNPAELKNRLKRSLPDYMVPSVIMVLEDLPLTPSGKVARRKLPAPEQSRDETNPYEAPRNPLEEQLVEIWSEVLGLERPGIHDDFFVHGGHSLLATKLVARARDQFDISLPLKFVFRYPTPATLAETIATLQATLQSTAGPGGDEREEFRI